MIVMNDEKYAIIRYKKRRYIIQQPPKNTIGRMPMENITVHLHIDEWTHTECIFHKSCKYGQY